MTAPQQIAVPAQDGVRADHQHKAPKLVLRQAMKQPSKEPINSHGRPPVSGVLPVADLQALLRYDPTGSHGIPIKPDRPG
ncbi:hypothetical protein ACWEPL_29790 [Nonomuraea sp. NPDC004186]